MDALIEDLQLDFVDAGMHYAAGALVGQTDLDLSISAAPDEEVL